MSIKVMGMVWDLSNEIIDREEKYVLLAYADHADHKGYNIFPAIPTIMGKTGYKERAAQIITKSLVAKGFLVADGKGPRGTNKWRIPLDEEGVRIAPAKNAPPQNLVDWGADGTLQGGALANAPESSETPETDKDIYKIQENRFWESVLVQLEPQMPRAAFDAYVRDTWAIGYVENTLTIVAPDYAARNWLEGRITSAAERMLIGIMNQGDVRVKFVVREEESVI